MAIAASEDTTIHRRLKAATKSVHDRLESRLPLLDPQLTLQDYRLLLRRFYGFYAPLEAAMRLATAGALREEVARRCKAHWLAADLIALGETEVGLAALPRCAAVPNLAGEAQVVGALYVVEGATLGGQMVLRFLGQSLGPEVSRCTRFFQSYGDHVRTMWASFLDLLAEVAHSQQQERDIIDAACATFTGFERWLDARSLERNLNAQRVPTQR
ncbi:biliverdin-producing heme oxygenase [Nitrospira moscoviensis]|uniref:Putative Heme oxygenase n=1 Tax=Nitrospira moscoviensis TaxID=42253 RepID=A0A0K2GDT3_NITMO|nr:biliverdin-producing heme oxygenase [Nitrospira moscoviensis]ALA59108.1 putative Heme oxygenase [Nitrospira moscoviensis]